MKPFFSIIIPLFNKENEIEDTLTSVLSQNFNDFEIIVINDGSTDKSLKKVEQYDHDRIRIFSTKNKGVSSARNYGIKKALGPYIAFLDADDYWYADHLETLYNLIKSFPEVGMYCSNYMFEIGKEKFVKTQFPSLPKTENWSGIVDDFFEASLNNRIAWTSAIAVKKVIFDSVGLFNTQVTLGAGEDLDMWNRIALKYNVAFTRKITAVYKLNASNRISLSAVKKRKYLTFEAYETIEKKHKTLKIFNDRYRGEFALHLKIAKDYKRYHYYLKKLDSKNLTLVTRVLLKLPIFILKPLLKFKRHLIHYSIYFQIN